jgi:glycosyltransferase involved in cell wall biosynthesis
MEMKLPAVGHHLRHPVRFRLVLARKLLLSKWMLRALRLRASRLRERPGSCTIAIVNWNSVSFLATVLDAIRRFSPADVEIVVVDNASEDGSRGFLRRQRGIKRLLLPVNIYHGPALDLAFLLSRAEFVVALDVDAFPISDGWLDRLLEPLADGFQISGVRITRDYAHPACAAMRRRRFVAERHTFAGNMRPIGYGPENWDTGELISRREQPRVFTFERTGQLRPGRGVLGCVYEGLVFHNAYSTRHREHLPLGADGPLDEERIMLHEVRDCWNEAVAQYLGR